MNSSATQEHRLGIAVFGVCLLVYGVTSFGALRSPDSEVVFEVCQSLADHATFAVEGVSDWQGFGLASGRDGRAYSVFGVGQSLACVPMLWAGQVLGIAGEGAPARINPSFYVDGGLRKFMSGLPLGARGSYGDRFVAAYLSVLAGALGAWVFYAIARRLSQRSAAALGVTALYAFGTLAWPYSGFCFSEPLAIVFVLLSLLGLLRAGDLALLAAGLALGCAVATHVTAILFVPFFAAYAFLGTPSANARRAGLAFCGGLAVVLVLLGVFNELRFGSPFETGRTIDAQLAQRFGYGRAVAPWRGVVGFIAGGGKSLFFFAPALIGGLLLLPAFLRSHRPLAWLIAGASLTRVVFIAGRSDWHGGFCLGPRLLLLIVPLLLLPLVPWLDAAIEQRRRGALVGFAVATWLCVSEQIAFSLGEPFTFYRRIMEAQLSRGVDVFAGDRLYLAWEFFPLRGLLQGPRGPWLLRDLPLSNVALWLLLSACSAGLCALAVRGWLNLRSPA